MENSPKPSITKRILAQIQFVSLRHGALIVSVVAIVATASLIAYQILRIDNQEIAKTKPIGITLNGDKQTKVDDSNQSLSDGKESSNPSKPAPQPAPKPVADKTQAKPKTPQPTQTATVPKPPDAGGGNSGGGTTPQKPPQPPQPPTWSAEAQQILNLVNQVRTATGLTPMTLNATLVEAANVRAHEITSLQSHTRPNGEPWYTINSLVRGENIAAGYPTVQEVFDAWMSSDEHRANILRPEFHTLGVGYVYQLGGDPEYIYYWVQLFGL